MVDVSAGAHAVALVTGYVLANEEEDTRPFCLALGDVDALSAEDRCSVVMALVGMVDALIDQLSTDLGEKLGILQGLGAAWIR